MKYILIFLIALSPFAYAQPQKEAELRIHSDSGIYGKTYAEIEQELRDLEKAYPDYATYFTYGTTIQGKKLSGLKIQKKVLASVPQASAIYIGGSIHGNEFLNIEDRLPRWILEEGLSKEAVIQNYLNNGGVFYMVPILNPDGYDSRERENAHGEDLNRDYPVRAAQVDGKSEPETTQWINYLESELAQSQLQLKYAIDYHCCIGALLYPWSFKTSLQLSPEKIKQYELVGSLMRNELGSSYKVGQTPRILGYSAYGTSKDYYHERFGALGFTFEGKYQKEKENFIQHTRFLISVIRELKL